MTEVDFKREISLEGGAASIAEMKLPHDFTLERAAYVGLDRFPVEVAFGDRGLRYRHLKEIYDFVSKALDRFDRLI